MTSAERADALVYGTNLLRMTNEAEASRVIAAEIDAAVAEALPRWTPVGEGLPEVFPAYGEEVLLTLENGSRCIGYRAVSCDDEEGWVNQDGEEIHFVVLAWQPLPAPWVAP